VEELEVEVDQRAVRASVDAVDSYRFTKLAIAIGVSICIGSSMNEQDRYG
jgi:hypothetical protein